jgi:hypothetical protein
MPQPTSSLADNMSNECEEVGGTRLDREAEDLFHDNFVHHKSHVI